MEVMHYDASDKHDHARTACDASEQCDPFFDVRPMVTDDHEKVTCGRCKATTLYKEGSE